jgi:hypothetical protein
MTPLDEIRAESTNPRGASITLRHRPIRHSDVMGDGRGSMGVGIASRR